MKFNWGTGIFLFYSIFALSLVVVVIQSRTFDNSLVFEDYYAKDITYQQTINRRNNSQALSQPLSLEVKAAFCQLNFPAELLQGPFNGTVHLYRPSSKKYDQTYPIAANAAGEMFIPTEGLTDGYYKALVNWSANGVDYYDEFPIYLKP